MTKKRISLEIAWFHMEVNNLNNTPVLLHSPKHKPLDRYPEDFNFSPLPYQIISTYCIVVNEQPVPSLIGCLSDFCLCPLVSLPFNQPLLIAIYPTRWMDSSESDNWLPRWARSFISVVLPGLIETG